MRAASLCLCALIAACSSAFGNAAPSLAGGDVRITRIGAFDEREPEAPRFAWPATEVRVAFEGPEITLVLSDEPREDVTRESDRVAITIDDGPPTKLVLKEGKQRYTVARGLRPGRHLLTLVKRTETEVGVITLHAVELPKGGKFLKAPAPSKRAILFIGDSISAGYGNEGKSAECHWDADLEDASRAFPVVTARALKAEAMVLAWSGKGVSRNFERRDIGTMPELFYRAVASDEEPVGVRLTPVPDAIVVALGTNDFFWSIPSEEAFLEAYRSLLRDLHQRAPKAPVFAPISPMLVEDYPHPQTRTVVRGWLEKIAREERQAGHTFVILEQWTDPKEGVGCDFHPNVKTQARLGKELAHVMRTTLGW